MVTHSVVAIAQIAITLIYLIGYFLMLSALILGKIHTPFEWKEVLQSLVSVLTAGVLLVLNFWFARSREPSGVNGSGR